MSEREIARVVTHILKEGVTDDQKTQFASQVSRIVDEIFDINRTLVEINVREPILPPVIFTYGEYPIKRIR